MSSTSTQHFATSALLLLAIGPLGNLMACQSPKAASGKASPSEMAVTETASAPSPDSPAVASAAATQSATSGNSTQAPLGSSTASSVAIAQASAPLAPSHSPTAAAAKTAASSKAASAKTPTAAQTAAPKKPPSAAPSTPADKTLSNGDSPAKPKVVYGTVREGDGFKTWLQSSQHHVVGKAAEALLVLESANPYKCNEKYPYKFQPENTEGITYPSPTLRNMKVSKHRSTMTIPFTANSAGVKTLRGNLSFSVCTKDKCLVEKQALNLRVDIAPR